MPYFVLGRTYSLRTTAGRIIDFVKGQPAWVPDFIIQEAVAIGAESVDGPVDVIPPDVEEFVQPVGTERERAVYAAFDALISKNARDDFSAHGVPTAKALQREIGFEMPNKERTDLWMKFKEMRAGA